MEATRATRTPLTATVVSPPPGAGETRAALRDEAAKGAATMLPLVVGYLPFALLIGVTAGASTDPLAAWAGSLLIFGGSAQLSVIELVGSGSGIAVAVCTGLLVNARLTVYSMSLLSLWRGAPLHRRLLAAAAVVDPMWLVATRRQDQPGTTAERRSFYAGAAATLAAGWVAMIGAGIVLGAHHGVTESLSICTPLCLTAVVAPHLRTAAGARCVVAAGIVAALTPTWPSGTGLLAAMTAGAAAGAWRPRKRG